MCNLVLCHCGVRRTYGSRCDCVYGPQGPPICGPSSGVKPAHSSISCSRCCGRVRRAPVRSIVSHRVGWPASKGEGGDEACIMALRG